MLKPLDILITSDTHGDLPLIDTPFDLMLMCGDICPAHDHYFEYQINWIQNKFSSWVNKLPFKNKKSKIIIIWGNHDFVGLSFNKTHEKCFNITTNNRAVFLTDKEYMYKYGKGKSLKIYGTPWCKRFGNWAFMLNNEALKLAYDTIPPDCDILMTHDAPDLNNLGLIQEGYYSGENAGNRILADTIKEKKPTFVFCGHIHSGNHELTEVNGTYMANVSYVDEGYFPTHQPLHIKINKETKNLI